MLGSVLRSSVAIAINRNIMRAFVEFRRMANMVQMTNVATKEDLMALKLPMFLSKY